MNNDLRAFNLELQTPRLRLRGLNKADRDLVFALRSDLRVIRHTGIVQYQDISQADDFIQKIEQEMEHGTSLTWTIFLSPTGQPIGNICFWNFSDDRKEAELGYDLLPDYWGQGYVSEAIQVVLDFGFRQYGFHTIYAYPRSEHAASCRVLEKADFRLIEKTHVEAEDGVFLTNVYKITNKLDI